MNLYYISISLVVISNVVYHISQKSTPTVLNPMLSLCVTYLTAAVISLIMMPYFNQGTSVLLSIKQLNWTSFALGFAVVGLELGFLLAYRSGWNIGVAQLAATIALTAILAPISVAFFKEHLSLTNLMGIVICLVGLILIGRR